MTWEIIAGLILQYGLPLAEKLWQKYAAGNPPTEADWAELKALAAVSMRDKLTQAMVRNGIDLQGELATKLLASI
jgi:protein-tyrosine-phosphatase